MDDNSSLRSITSTVMATSSTRPVLSSSTAKLFGARPHSYPQIFPFLAPCTVSRHASGASKGAKKASSGSGSGSKKGPKAKKVRSSFKRDDIKLAEKFSLCDAMRYIRAFEVGRDPTVSKYELAVNMATLKNGPVIRGRLRLPNSVKSAGRIAVICPPDSSVATEALEAGASLVGEQAVFEAVKSGNVDFDHVLCHTDSAGALASSGVARILGPRGLMPNTKNGTISKDIVSTMNQMVGGTQYREKIGTIRAAIGQLRFTPEQLEANIQAFMGQLKKDVGNISETTPKQIHEVILSATNSPGFTLSGLFRDPNSISPEQLRVF